MGSEVNSRKLLYYGIDDISGLMLHVEIFQVIIENDSHPSMSASKKSLSTASLAVYTGHEGIGLIGTGYQDKIIIYTTMRYQCSTYIYQRANNDTIRLLK